MALLSSKPVEKTAEKLFIETTAIAGGIGFGYHGGKAVAQRVDRGVDIVADKGADLALIAWDNAKSAGSWLYSRLPFVGGDSEKLEQKSEVQTKDAAAKA